MDEPHSEHALPPVDLPLRQEEIHVERRPLAAPLDATARPPYLFEELEIVFPLRAEVPVVNRLPVLYEEVTFRRVLCPGEESSR